jgi:hypothetical protein
MEPTLPVFPIAAAHQELFAPQLKSKLAELPKEEVEQLDNSLDAGGRRSIRNITEASRKLLERGMFAGR